MSINAEHLPLKERISYGMLDTAGNMAYCFSTTYILYYFTDVAGIAVATAGFLLLLSRIVDGIDAPIWGIIIDKTKSKYGKCRPWFLWLPIPFAILGALVFYSPDVDMSSKVLYAGTAYLIYNISFTGLNTPLTAILPLLTKNPKERLVLNSFRMVGGQIGTLLMNATAFPLIALFGAGNDKHGFLVTACIYGFISILLQFYAFCHLKEIDADKVTQEKRLPIKDSFRADKGNWPWVIMVVTNLIFWIAMMARNSTVVYYLTYNLGQKSLVVLINSLGSIGILAIICIPFICRYITKKSAWIGGLVFAIVGEFIMWIGGANLPIIIIGWILSNLGSSVACSMPFAMLGSAVDYGEWKTGIRSTGFLTAFGSTFCIKAGSGLGAAIPAWIMAAFGYVANQSQTGDSLFGISCAFIWFPMVVFAIAIIPLLFYSRYEKMESQVREDLANRAVKLESGC